MKQIERYNYAPSNVNQSIANLHIFNSKFKCKSIVFSLLMILGFINVEAQEFYSNEIYCRGTIVNALPLFSNNNVPGTANPTIANFVTQNSIFEIRKAYDSIGQFLSDNTYIIRFSDSSRRTNILATVTTLPNINYACKRPINKLFCTTEAANYWQGFSDKSYYLRQTNYCKAMSTFTATGTPVKLAIVDNGFNTSHQDFINGANNVFDLTNSYDVSDNNTNINPPANCPIFKHGTAMASVIGAQNNNSLGGASLARTNTGTDIYKILGIKSTKDVNDFDLGAAINDNGYVGIQKAAQNGAKVISCSWGFYNYNTNVWSNPDAQFLYDIMTLYPDILLVFAAGNSGSDTYVGFPACANQSNWQVQLTSGGLLSPVPMSITDRIISVGAIDATNKKPYFSCYGPDVDIFTYGTNISVATGNTTSSAEYEYGVGTSIAAPQVAAVAAMYRFKYPSASAIATKGAILSGATSIEGQNPSFAANSLGRGKLDIFNTINNLTIINQQIRINLSQTQFCLNSASSFSIGVTNISTGLTVTNVSTKISGLTATPYIGTNLTNLIFTNPGIYDVTITITLSDNSVYEYQTGITVYNNKVTLLTQSENPVCENNAVQMLLENTVYGVARRVEYTYNLSNSNAYCENFEGNNKYYFPLWVQLNSSTPGYPNPVLNIGQASYFEADYNIYGFGLNPVLTCPLSNSTYTYNVTCCNANTITNGTFSTIGTSAIGFSTSAVYNSSASNFTNRFNYPTVPNFGQIPGASNGNYLMYNGPYDDAVVTSGGVSIPPQNITFSPAPVFDNWYYSKPGLSASIWNQTQSFTQGNTYNFSFNLSCENPKLSDSGLPLNLDVTITNGTYTMACVARSYNRIIDNFTPIGRDPYTYQTTIVNFAGASGTYTISINQRDHFSANYFNTWIDDISLKRMYTACEPTGTVLTSPLSATPLPSINGYDITANLSITGSVTFTNTDVRIKNNSSIIVDNGATLNIIASHLHGCSDMWQGITVKPGGKLVIKGNLNGASSLIEDATTAVTCSNHTSTALYILDITNTIFNKNSIGIYISDYVQNTPIYPFKIEGNVFTCRTLPGTPCANLWPNWPTVASLQAVTTNTVNVLASPYNNLNSYPIASLLNLNAEISNTHIKAVKVGYTDGTLSAPNYIGMLALNTVGTGTLVPAINLFDYSANGVYAQDANLKIVNSVFQNCKYGILAGATLGVPKSIPQQPYSNLQILNSLTATNSTGANKFYDNKSSDINIGTYATLDILNNEFRSTQSKTNMVNSSFPSINNNIVGKCAINIGNNNTLVQNIKGNIIYNHKAGIIMQQTIQAAGTSTITLNKFPGDVNIANNTIQPSPGGATGTILPFVSEGINTSMSGGPLTTTYTIVPTSTKKSLLNIDANTINNVYRGIEVLSFNWPKDSTRVTNNIISQDADPNNSTTSMQHGIWCANNKGSLLVRSNNVTFNGTIPASVGNMSNLFNTNANVSGRQTNYRMDQNDRQVITCNNSQRGMIGFEFNGVSANTQFRNFNNMVNSHFLGMLLNNGGIIGVQPAGINTATCASNAPNTDAGNTWSFAANATTNQPKHTWVQNAATIPITACNPTNTNMGAGASAMQVPFSGLNRPQFNSGNGLPNTFYGFSTNNSLRTVTGPASGCAPPLSAAKLANGGSAIGNVHILNAVANGLSFEAMSAELNYMDKYYLYVLQKSNDDYITASTDLQTFFNTANAPTSNYRKMWDIDEAISQGNASIAQTLNNAFVATNIAENNTKTYNDIAIKAMQEIALTTTDNTNLFNIANECPHTDGICVYNARVLYNQLALSTTGDFVSFPDNCNPSGLYKTSPMHQVMETEGFDAIIYPNPTTDGFNIDIIDGVVKNLILEIMNVEGKMVQKENVQLIQNSIYVKTNIAPGVYIIKMQNQFNETITKKLVVQ